MKPRRIFSAARLSLPLATALAALITSHSANAASQIWDGGGADANWSTVGNWVGDPVAPGATSGTTNTDVATFNAAIANTWGLTGTPILIDANRNIGGISFTQAAGNYFVGTTAGSSLRLTSAGTIQILSGLTATNAVETINAPLVIQGAAGTYTFANNSANGSGAGAGTLNLAGGITGGAAGATVLTLSGSNTNANTISSIIANGTATTMAVTKSGAGTWTLGGVNTYTGATAINQGTLILTGGRAGATTGALTMGTGSAGTLGTVGNLTVNTANVTVGAITVRSNTATTTGADIGLLSIASGRTLTASSFAAGVATADPNSTNTALSTGAAGTGGTLTVTGNFTMSPAGGSSTDRANTVVNLSGLTNFNVTSLTGSLTVGSAINSKGTLTLANTANNINVGTLSVGDSGSSNYNAADVSTINLGAGTNALSAPNLDIGAGKGGGVIQFAGAGGSVVITGASGAGTSTIIIGDASAGTYQGSTNQLLLAGHTATVSASSVVMSRKNSASAAGGSVSSQLTFDTGTFTASTILMAGSTATADSGSSGTMTGTFTVGGATANSAATGVVNIGGNLLLANLLSTTSLATGVGTLTINGGTVNFTTPAAGEGIFDTSVVGAGASTTTLTLQGGTLNLNGGVIGGITGTGKRNITNLNFRSGTLQNVLQINGGAGLTKSSDGTGGGGTLILSGVNSFTGGVTVNAGILVAGSSGNGTTSSLGSVSNTRTITVNTGGTLRADVGNIFSGNFAAAATSLPVLNIAGGTMTNGGTATNSALGSVTLAGGTLTATVGSGSGYGSWNLNGTVTSTGTSTISSSASVPITLSAAAGTTTIFDVQSGKLTASAALGQVTASGDERTSGLTKIGAGTMILSGTNTYTGATNIDVGILVVNGSIVSSATNVGGGTTLTGSGTVGSTTVAGTGNVSNNNGVAGASLTIDSLTFEGGANVDTFSSSTSAPIIVTNSLASGLSGTVSINPSAASWTNGLTYDLISYGSHDRTGLGFAPGTVTGLTARQSFIFGESTNAITLAISGDTPKWTGLDNGNWQIGSTGASENWKLVTAGTATTFLATDDVLFDDTATLKTVDISNGNVSPSAMVFNNSSGNDYTVTGSNGIATGSLTKNNTGTVTLSTNNTYAGDTTLNAGTLALGNANAIGSGTLTITGGSLDSSVANLVNAGNNAQAWNGDFAFTGTENLNLGTGAVTMGANRTVTVTANTLTVGGVIGGGAVSLTKAGAGTLILTGNNTYSGGTTINDNSGTLQATKNAAVTNAIGSGAVGIGAGSTLVLDITKTTNITDAIANTFSGAGLLKLQFAAGTTARNTTITNVTGFNGTIQLSNLGSTGDKWNAASLGTVAGSLLVDSGSTIFVQTAPASFTGGITLNGAGSSEGRGAIRMGATSLGGNITLGSSSTIGMESAASALLTGTISSGAAGTQTLTLGGTASTGGTLSGIIGGGTGAIDLATAVGGTYTLTNTNTYTGTTTIAASTTLQLGNGTTGNDGTIANTSGVTNNGTLTFNRFGSVSEAYAITGTGAVTKLGAGTQTLSGLSATEANNYSGTTTINEGILAFTTTNPSLTGGLRFGTANTNTTAGILDLTNASATFGGTLTVNTNSATASEIKIGAAQTLTINNNVQIGATPPVANAVTRLNMTGGGVFNVATAAAGTFNVGGTTLVHDSTLDLTALSATTINTSSTGTIRVNANSGTNVNGTKSSLLLPTPVAADTVATATLTAGTIAVGNSSTFNSLAGQINTLRLGTGLTTLNADTIGVGTGGRDIGQIIFGQIGGDLKIRAADGTSRATALNVATGGATTATSEATTNNLVDFSNHDADILVTSLNVGNQARVGNLTSEFKFGTGDASLASVLDATNVNIGFRTGTATATSVLTNRVILSGGSVTFGNVGATGTGVNIGSSTYSGAGAASVIGELNISGGSVTIHNSTSLGAAVRLGSNVATGGGTVTASMNLTGGTTTLGGDIIKGATSPRTTSTLSLNDASAILDMGGNDITSLDTITYTDGTLKNLGTVNTDITLVGTGSRVFDQGTGVIGEIQGAITGTGIGLTKQGDGKLTLSGTNNYTSATLVSAGTLFVTGSLDLNSNVTVKDAATLGGGGTVGDISFEGSSSFDIALAVSVGRDSLTSGAISFAAAGFDIDSLVSNGAAVIWGDVPAGNYILITGTLISANLGNFGLANAADIGGGRTAYFESGSLQLVVVPEPSDALLGCLSALLLLRRRR